VSETHTEQVCSYLNTHYETTVSGSIVAQYSGIEQHRGDVGVLKSTQSRSGVDIASKWFLQVVCIESRPGSWMPAGPGKCVFSDQVVWFAARRQL
jgi:hypothetical protein